MIHYKTSGTCSKEIIFEIEDNKIKEIQFVNGCPGNLMGISNLVKGMDIDTVIKKFENVVCGNKSTSCPAQLALALKKYRGNM